jgi:hypothetical protein
MHRGITPNGPIKEMINSWRAPLSLLPMSEGVRFLIPILEPTYSTDSVIISKNFLLSPFRSTIAISPKNGTNTAVKKNPLMARAHISPVTRPKLKGKTMLPDPKNMAKIAKPARTVWRFIKLLSFKEDYPNKNTYLDPRKSKDYNQANIFAQEMQN